MAGRRRGIVRPRSCFVVGGAGEGGCGGRSGGDRRGVHGGLTGVFGLDVVWLMEKKVVMLWLVRFGKVILAGIAT